MAKKKELKRRMIEYAVHLDQAEARIDELEQRTIHNLQAELVVARGLAQPPIYSHPEYMALASKYQEILGRVGQTVINLRQYVSNLDYIDPDLAARNLSARSAYAEALRQVEEIIDVDQSADTPHTGSFIHRDRGGVCDCARCVPLR